MIRYPARVALVTMVTSGCPAPSGVVRPAPLAAPDSVSPATVDSLEAQGVWVRDKVDEPPALLSMPQVEYPEIPGMRTGGGRIILQGIVDQAGNIEPASIRVVAAFEPRLAAFAAEAFRKARFKSAWVHGQPVRVLVNLPIDFAPRRPRERQP